MTEPVSAAPASGPEAGAPSPAATAATVHGDERKIRRPGPREGAGAPSPAVSSLALLAARTADEKSGRDTVVLDVSEALSITDAFVITSASNVRHVRTLAEEIEERIKANLGVAPRRVEGLDDARWILMDYGDVVVHVFLDEAREFYDLEHLWSGVPRLNWGAPQTS